MFQFIHFDDLKNIYFVICDVGDKSLFLLHFLAYAYVVLLFGRNSMGFMAPHLNPVKA